MRKSTLLPVLGATALLATASQAAIIDGSSDVAVAADGSNVGVTGFSQVWGYNFVSDTTGLSVGTVNGLTFTPLSGTTANNSSTVVANSDISFTQNLLTPFNGGNNTVGWQGVSGDGGAQGIDAGTDLEAIATEYLQTIGSGAFANGNNNQRVGDLTLLDLAIGTEYSLQLLVGRDSGTQITITEDDGTDILSVAQAGSSLPRLVTINFTAEATSETFLIEPDNGRGVVNAASLLVIPEPSSFALLGLGGLMMLRRRNAKA